eukprot:gene2240-8033_t
MDKSLVVDVDQFQFDDDDLEGDLEEIELENFHESSLSEKKKFLLQRAKELKAREQELCQQKTSSAAIEVVAQRSAIIHSYLSDIDKNIDIKIKKIPQVPSVSYCLKQNSQNPSSRKAISEDDNHSNDPLAGAAILNDDFDLDNMNDMSDDNINDDMSDTEMDVNSFNEPQKKTNKRSSNHDKPSPETVDAQSENAVVGSSHERNREFRSTHAPSTQQIVPTDNDSENRFIFLQNARTLKLQYKSASRSHLSTGNKEYSSRCEQVLSLLEDIESHVESGKSFDRITLPSPPEPVDDSHAKAFDSLEKILRDQAEECLKLAETYHQQGNINFQQKLLKFAEKFKRDLQFLSVKRGQRQMPSSLVKKFTFPVERMNLHLTETELEVAVKRCIALKIPKDIQESHKLYIKATLMFPKDNPQEHTSKEFVACSQHPEFSHTKFKFNITRDRRFTTFSGRGAVQLTVLAQKQDKELCKCSIPLSGIATSSTVHNSFSCGRLSTTKLELRFYVSVASTASTPCMNSKSPSGRDIVEKEYTWKILQPDAANENEQSVMEDDLDSSAILSSNHSISSVERTVSPKGSNALTSTSSSPASSKYSQYLHPKHVTSHAALLDAQKKSTSSPKQRKDDFQTWKLCVSKIKYTKALLDEDNPKLQEYFQKVFKDMNNFKRLVPLCKDTDPRLATLAQKCFHAVQTEIESASNKHPSMIEKCRESASNNTSPKANKTGSSQKTPPTSQASVPAKESNEQLIKEIPVRNAQQTPSSPATPGSYSPKGDNSSVPPKSIPPPEAINSKMALVFLFQDLDNKIRPHSHKFATGDVPADIMKLARQRTKITSRIREMDLKVQAAVESGNDIRPMIEKYLENLLVDRDKFIRAYKQLESVNKDEKTKSLRDTYFGMMQAVAGEIEETKEVLSSL